MSTGYVRRTTNKLEYWRALAEPVLGPATPNAYGADGRVIEYRFNCPLHEGSTGGLVLSVSRTTGEPRWYHRSTGHHCSHWMILLQGLADLGVPRECLPSDFTGDYRPKSPDTVAHTRKARESGAETARTAETKPLPDEEVLQIYREVLLENVPARLDYLLTTRLWRLEDVLRLGVGWNPQRKCYVVPIRDRNDDLANVRYWFPDRPKDGPLARWLSWRGVQASPMWPVRDLLGAKPGSRVLVCAGEPDALAALAQGWVAVTGTSGEGTPLREEDLYLLAGYRVLIALDADVIGRKAAADLEKRLRAFGRCSSVRNWNLFPDYSGAPGEPNDLTDYIRLRNERMRVGGG